MNSGNLRVLGLFLCQNRRRKVMKKYIAICEKSSIMENLAEALPEKLVKRGRNYYGEHYQIHALSVDTFLNYLIWKIIQSIHQRKKDGILMHYHFFQRLFDTN